MIVGSFSTFAAQELGEGAGFVVGWIKAKTRGYCNSPQLCAHENGAVLQQPRLSRILYFVSIILRL